MGTFKKLPIFHQMNASGSIHFTTVVILKYHGDSVSLNVFYMVFSETDNQVSMCDCPLFQINVIVIFQLTYLRCHAQNLFSSQETY